MHAHARVRAWGSHRKCRIADRPTSGATGSPNFFEKIKGLHENDFIMATKIDQIFDRSTKSQSR